MLIIAAKYGCGGILVYILGLKRVLGHNSGAKKGLDAIFYECSSCCNMGKSAHAQPSTIWCYIFFF